MIAPTTLAVAEIFSAAKMYGSDAGNAQLPEHRPAARGVGAHQLERARVGRVQAAQRVDRDREERQVGGDHRDRAQPGDAALRAEPDDDHRRDREDRHVCEATT